ncbi:hypothetical protein [Hoeflea sp.]|nr:hypothetical protein [Hoeflea sp.]
MYRLDIAFLRVYIGTHYAATVVVAAFAKRLAYRDRSRFDRFVIATS